MEQPPTRNEWPFPKYKGGPLAPVKRQPKTKPAYPTKAPDAPF